MSKHLPECTKGQNNSLGGVCLCPALLACERRVRAEVEQEAIEREKTIMRRIDREAVQ